MWGSVPGFVTTSSSRDNLRLPDVQDNLCSSDNLIKVKTQGMFTQNSVPHVNMLK